MYVPPFPPGLPSLPPSLSVTGTWGHRATCCQHVQGPRLVQSGAGPAAQEGRGAVLLLLSVLPRMFEALHLSEVLPPARLLWNSPPCPAQQSPPSGLYSHGTFSPAGRVGLGHPHPFRSFFFWDCCFAICKPREPGICEYHFSCRAGGFDLKSRGTVTILAAPPPDLRGESVSIQLGGRTPRELV